jgi:hypothetical protein
MPDFTFLWPHVGPRLINLHFISPNEVRFEIGRHFISKHYDERSLGLESKVLQPRCKEAQN